MLFQRAITHAVRRSWHLELGVSWLLLRNEALALAAELYSKMMVCIRCVCLGLSNTTNHKTDILIIFFSTVAVCDFCKKRESELYQKEVCLVYICVNHGRLVFISGAEDCWSVSFRSLICRLWRRNSLVCGLSVSAVKVHCMKMCCVPGIYTLGLDNIV